jgi:hypothetical protein
MSWNRLSSQSIVAATALTVGIGAVTVGPASAANNIKPFGQQETLDGYAPVRRLAATS